MTLGSLSSTRSPSLSTQEPTHPAPGHPGVAAANALQPPDGLPALRRTAQPGPSAPSQLRAALPPATTTVFVPVLVPVYVPVFQPVFQPVRYEIMLSPEQAMALTRAQELANQYDFGLQLALVDKNYAVLQQRVQEVNHAAGQFRLQWAETGSRECLAAAQGLDIEGALLNGLYAIRRIHKDWLSQAPVVSPEKLMYVLPLFRHALHLCETRSDAVQFPIAGLKPALERLHQQVVASLQSLQAGQWQATDDGQQYAQRRDPIRTGHADSSPNPFTRLEVACRDLQQVLERLQTVLVHGPAALQPAAAAVPQEQPPAALPAPQTPAQAGGPQEPAAPHAAGSRSFKSVLSMGLPASGNAGTSLQQPTLPAHPVATKPAPVARRAPDPALDTRVPRRTPTQRGPVHPQATRAARNPAAPALPPIKARRNHPAAAGPGAAPTASAAMPLSPSSPPASPTRSPTPPQARLAAPSSATAKVAVPPPADPAAEAAEHLRKERFTTLRNTIHDPLQAEATRLSEAAEAEATSSTAAGQPWERFTREFAAWQAVVEVHDLCSTTLAAKAAEVFGPGSEDPDVRRLLRDIDTASREALGRASQAADNTLAAFAQTCHTAIVEGKLDRVGIRSYAQLAALCRDLHQQWQDAPLRPHMPELEGRMAQYDAYEMACRAKDEDPASSVPVLAKAELLYEAATQSRRAFAGAQSALADRLHTFHRECMRGRSVILEKAVELEVKAIQALHGEQSDELTPALRRAAEIAASFDTLLAGDPLQPARPPGSEKEPWSPQREHDHLLVEDACDPIGAALAQGEQAIKLPAHAVPQRAVHEQQAGQAVLRHVELTATTAATALDCFHALSEALGTTPLEARPALVRTHAETLKKHESDLLEALRNHQNFVGTVREPPLPELLDISQTRLRADLRMMQRMHLALTAQEQLLKERVSAQQIHSDIEQSSLADLRRPDLNGSAHDTIADVLNAGLKSVEQALRKEKEKIRSDAWQAESDLHGQGAAAMRDQIACEKVLIQGHLLLAWAARASQPQSGHLERPADIRALETQVATLTQALAQDINPALKRRTASPEHGDKYKAQLAASRQVQGDLLRLLTDLRKRSAAVDAEAGSSSQTEVPAAQPAGPDVRESRSSRRSRAGRR